MHVLHHHAAADAAGTIDPRGRAIALSVVFAAGSLLFIMAPLSGERHAGSAGALIAAFGAGWGFARAQPRSIGRPDGDTLGLPGVGGRLAAGAGGRYGGRPGRRCSPA